MAITIKRLIAELSKIDNKLLEVEIQPNNKSEPLEIDRVEKVERKVLLTVKVPRKY
jgi:hypothetical protein